MLKANGSAMHRLTLSLERVSHEEAIAITQRPFDSKSIARSDDRFDDGAGFHASFTVDLAILLGDSVARDARYTLAEDSGAIDQGLVASEAHGRCNGCVTTETEVTNSTLRKPIERVFETREHRRDRGVRMVGDGPLFIDLAVAFGAGRRRWVRSISENLGMRICSTLSRIDIEDSSRLGGLSMGIEECFDAGQI